VPPRSVNPGYGPEKLVCPVHWSTVLPKYDLSRDMTYGRQHVTTIGSIDLDSQMDVILVRKSFAPTYLFFAAAVYNQSFCELFSVANDNSLISLNQKMIRTTADYAI